MKTTISLTVTHPDRLSPIEVAGLIDRLIAAGYTEALESVELHESGDYEDADVLDIKELEIGDAQPS